MRNYTFTRKITYTTVSAVSRESSVRKQVSPCVATGVSSTVLSVLGPVVHNKIKIAQD